MIVKIKLKSKWIFKYGEDDFIDCESCMKISFKKQDQCENCGIVLSASYLEIINNLRKANLLPEDYKQLCCTCFVLNKVDALPLSDNLYLLDYNGYEDIMTLFFKIKSLTYIYINVYDWSKYYLL